MTELDDLIYRIHPVRSSLPIQRRADKGINAIQNWPDALENFSLPKCQTFLTAAHARIESALLGAVIPVQAHLHTYWNRCLGTLEEVYGEAGLRTAYDFIRNGKAREVVNDIARHLVKNTVLKNVRMAANAYWGHLSYEQREAACQEYLAKYGHLLPWDQKDGTAAYLRAHFPKVIVAHHRLLDKAMRLGCA